MPLPRFAKLDPEKQNQIIEAARTEFSTHPYASASLNRIILTAGISKGALYYYFDDKDDLFSTALSSWANELLDHVESEVRAINCAAEFWDEAERLIQLIATRIIDQPGLTAMITHGMAAKAQGLLKLKLDVIEKRLIGRLNAVLDIGTELGALRNDLERPFFLKLAMSVARTSDEWLVQSKNRQQTRKRVKQVAENYQRLFGAKR